MVKKKCMFDSKHQEMGRTVPRCFCCKKKIGKTEEEKTQEKIDKVSKEKKQAVRDLLHGGKNIGQISKELDINDTMVVAGIILGNVEKISFIRKTVM